jgi:hypothetical protein
MSLLCALLFLLPEDSKLTLRFYETGIFARKYGIAKDEVLPSHILHGPMQPTINYLSLQMSKQLWNIAMRRSGASYELDMGRREKLEKQAAARFLAEFREPPTPGVFFDEGLYFRWDDQPQAIVNNVLSKMRRCRRVLGRQSGESKKKTG